MKKKTKSLPLNLQRFVLGFMGLGVISMVISLVYIGFTQPSLMQHNPVTDQSAGAQVSNTQAIIGQLMQRIAENPNDFEPLIALSEHLLHTEEWQQAEPFIKRAIKIKPNEMQPYYLLGFVQNRAGLYKEAAKTLEHALTLEDTASLRYNLGVLYAFFLEDTARAKAMLKKALTAPRGNPALIKDIEDAIKQLDKPS